MSADALPQFDDRKTYVLSGKTLNKIIAAIKAARIISVEGKSITRTPEGIIIKGS